MIAHELHILLWLNVYIYPLWLMGINLYKTTKISLILLVLCEPAIPGSSGRPSHLGTLAIRENPWRASLCTYIWGVPSMGATNSWMVYFMDHYFKMDDFGVPLFQEPPKFWINQKCHVLTTCAAGLQPVAILLSDLSVDGHSRKTFEANYMIAKGVDSLSSNNNIFISTSYVQ